MRSVTSYFNPVLFKKNLTRFWPIWALYGAIWFFILPFNILSSGPCGMDPTQWSFVNEQVLRSSIGGGVALSLCFGLLAAMAVFSYLYNNRSAGFLHALPLRREGLFLTNYLSGLCFFLIPLVMVFFLALGAEVLVGAVYLPALLQWLGMQLLLNLFFYSFAVFCAMFTGHLLALPAFYGVLNVLAVGMASLLNVLMQAFVFGFRSAYAMEEFAAYLSPVFRLYQNMNIDYTIDPLRGSMENPWMIFTVQGWPTLLAYALVGVVLAGLALLLYRKRHIECAGDVISIRMVRPVFKYGVTFCCAIALGTLLYMMFMGQYFRTPWVLLLFMLFAGAVGYFAAEMLLAKSFRVFRRSWKGCVAFALVLVAATCGMTFDVTGFERRQVRADAVESATVLALNALSYGYSGVNSVEITDPAELDALLQLHGSIVARRAELKADDAHQYGSTYATTYNYETYRTVTVRMAFTLRDGKQMIRQYDLPVTEAQLGDATSPAALLLELMSRPAVAERAYGDFGLRKSEQLVNVALTGEDRAGQYLEQNVVPTAAQTQELLQALHADFAAGRLGRLFLLDNAEYRAACYQNSLELTYFIPESALPPTENKQRNGANRGYSIPLQTTATETLRVLEALGLVPTLR